VGIDRIESPQYRIFDDGVVRQVPSISQYLTGGSTPVVEPRGFPISGCLPEMILGNMPNDGGALSLTFSEREQMTKEAPNPVQYIRRFYGSKEYNNDLARYCLWI
jgi:hypothetical protein